MTDESQSFIFTVLILLIIAAFFAITETAFSSVSVIKIRLDEERGDRRAVRAFFILDHFDKAVTTLLICTNIVHIALAGVVTAFVTRKWGLSLVTLGTILTTIAVFFFGEMLPKSIARKIPHQIALATADILYLLMKLCTPLAFLLSGIGGFFAGRLHTVDEVSITEDELEVILDDMTEDGTLDANESRLISSAIRFRKTTAGEIMTPLDRVFYVSQDGEPEAVYHSIIEQSHSRIPVFDREKLQIVGVVHLRDYLRASLRDHIIPTVKEIMSPVLSFPPATEIDELLDAMTRKRTNIAVIAAEDHTALGIITVEDILEELVGEIYDEDDQPPREREEQL